MIATPEPTVLAPRPAYLQPGHPLFALGYAPPVQHRAFVRADSEGSEECEGGVAEEIPVAIVYNEMPHVVMMASPAELEDFGVGFTLSEQIVAHASDIGGVRVVRHSEGAELHIEIPFDDAQRAAGRARRLVGRTGCGLCGVELLSDAVRPAIAIRNESPIAFEALVRAERELHAAQRWNRETGSMHAAAWATHDGAVEFAREDLGRHNAVDKVIGALARAGREASEGFLVVTSRASYELVQKAAVAGIPLLAAISRPTGLAIRMAESSGMTLVGLLRDGSANIYAHGERLQSAALTV